MGENHYLGVDVGTGSVRAALIRRNGEIIRTSTCPIKTWNPQKDYFEQSSEDIWRGCCRVIKNTVKKRLGILTKIQREDLGRTALYWKCEVGSFALLTGTRGARKSTNKYLLNSGPKDVSQGTDPRLIKGIGFDATCSLVCIGANGKPLTVSPTGNNEQNIILWMDHRAKAQADFINLHKPKILRYLGGNMSLEMETPKLMWIKENLKETWNGAKYFFDLVDFLTWKATDDESRSLCTVVCKWTFEAGEDNRSGWDEEYFSLIGLRDLLDDGATKIGSKVKIPGERCGSGLTESAARDFGLLPGTCVGAGIIDAHAGGLGLLTSYAPGINPPLEAKISLICGTSTCHMVVNQLPRTVAGIWGPYFSAMVPDMYLNEAGQSATGKLIDFVIDTHPATERLKMKLKTKMHIHEYLNALLQQMSKSKNLISPATLTSRCHIWPDFHGNRSPLADASILGMMSGLNLVSDEYDLALRYLATIQSLAYGTRHILDTLRSQGYDKLSTVLMCGGLSKNKLFVQVHADVLDLPVLLPDTPEPVLLGAGILGMVAAREWQNVQEAVKSVKGQADVFMPCEADREYHSRKYRVFLKMIADQKSYDALMGDFARDVRDL